MEILEGYKIFQNIFPIFLILRFLSFKNITKATCFAAIGGGIDLSFGLSKKVGEMLNIVINDINWIGVSLIVGGTIGLFFFYLWQKYQNRGFDATKEEKRGLKRAINKLLETLGSYRSFDHLIDEVLELI